jgi:hypothetical protein
MVGALFVGGCYLGGWARAGAAKNTIIASTANNETMRFISATSFSEGRTTRARLGSIDAATVASGGY